MRRVAPMVGLLYTTLVLWFAEGVHATAVATPPVRPWYPHKRGLAFTDVLRAAQRSLAATDVLDPANHSKDLHKSPGSRGTRCRRRRDNLHCRGLYDRVLDEPERTIQHCLV